MLSLSLYVEESKRNLVSGKDLMVIVHPYEATQDVIETLRKNKVDACRVLVDTSLPYSILLTNSFYRV